MQSNQLYLAMVFILTTAPAVHSLEVNVQRTNQQENINNNVRLDMMDAALDRTNTIVTKLEQEIEDLKASMPPRVEVGYVIHSTMTKSTDSNIEVVFAQPFDVKPKLYVVPESIGSGPCRGFRDGVKLRDFYIENDVNLTTGLTANGFRITLPGSGGGCGGGFISKVTWIALENK